jgi:uncharacterized protein YdbL (DUF1318 family)
VNFVALTPFHFISKGITMKNRIALLTLALACLGSASAFAMTKEEYKTQKERIEADYKATRDKCKTFQANAKDICHAEAKNVEKVARAELDAQYKPSASADKKVKNAKAEGAYAVAKEKCDDLKADAKATCIKDARAARDSAKV